MNTGSQYSKDNPGWRGSGIPTAKSISREFIKQIYKSFKYKKFKLVKNTFLASLINYKNFILQKNKLGAICPCCNYQGPAFIAKANWREVSRQASCPICDSYSRHRGLAKILPQYIKKGDNKILFFAPEKIIIELLTREGHAKSIFTTDKHSQDVDFKNEDIQDMSFDDGIFDYIICNHVLEHVKDDQKALEECSRILNKNGTAFFTIPGDFTKQKTVEFKKLDPNGHYRHYGLDVVAKMKNAFRSVETMDLSACGSPLERIRQGDMLFLCSN